MRYFSLFIFLCVANFAGAQGIDFFNGTLDEAKALSKKTGKLIFIDCFTTWCGPCKRMASQVFTQQAVGEYYNANFVNMKIDMEKGEGRSVAGTYGITAYPTLIFIDHQGQLVTRKVGGTDGPGFIELGRQAAAKNDQSPAYAAQYEAGDHSPELVYKYIKALNDAGKPSGKIANQYFKTNPKPNNEWDYKIIYEAAQTIDVKAFDLFDKNQKNISNYFSAAQMDAKVKSILNKSIERAVEFQSNEIAGQIKAYAAKKLNKNDAAYFEHFTNLKMADSRRDVTLLNTSALRLAELANKDDKRELNDIIYILKAKYADDKSTIPVVLALYDKQADISDNPKDRLNYGLYLFNYGDKAKAIREAERARSEAAEKKRDTTEYDTVIQFIKSKSQ